MKREDYVKKLIKSQGYTVKSFAESIEMPYSTLLSMLNNSIGGASVDNVIRICKGLDITVNDLQSVENEPTKNEISSMNEPRELVKEEILLLDNYRSLNQQGKDYIKQSMDLAKNMYSKKFDDTPIKLVARDGNVTGISEVADNEQKEKYDQLFNDTFN